MTHGNLGERFIRWAHGERSIVAMTLIGSQARKGATHAAADSYSDWDFQVVTSQPGLFATRDWMVSAGIGAPLAYVWRGGRLGSAAKATAVFPDGELDVVVLPASKLKLARFVIRVPALRRIQSVKRGLADLSVVLRGGCKVLKGGRAWETFFQRVASEIPVVRLSDADVRALAEGFFCDYVATCQKIDRGEMLAAQRWLHHLLAETNFTLLHELRSRAQLPSFPDARRLELLADRSHLAAVEVAALPNVESLRAAVEKSAETCRRLVRELIGEAWQWPG